MENKARIQRNKAQENELRGKIGLEDDRKRRDRMSQNVEQESQISMKPVKKWKQSNLDTETNNSEVEATSREWSHVYK